MNNENFSQKRPYQFIWEDNSDRNFQECLKSPDTQLQIQGFLTNDFPTDNQGINDCFQSFNNILQNTAKKCLKTRSRTNNPTNKKWFDKKCRLKRHAVRKIANKT